MKYFLLLIFASFFYCFNISEGSDSKLLYKEARKALNNGELSKCVIICKSILEDDKYRYKAINKLAEVYSIKKDLDSSFFYINLLKEDKDYFMNCVSSPHYRFISKDVRFDSLITISLNEIGNERGEEFDIDLTLELLKMQMDDQAYYYEIELVESLHGANSFLSNGYWELKEELNILNLIKLDSIVSIKGFPNNSTTYGGGNSAWLVVQHSSLDVMLKYLPLIKEKYEAGEFFPQSYAMFIDRIALEQDKPQKYGTQFVIDNETNKYKLYKLQNEDSLNYYRQQMMLPPMH